MELSNDMIEQIQKKYEKENCDCKYFQEYINKLEQENKYLKEQIEDIKTILEIINQWNT